LSEENLDINREYLRMKRLKYSILEKSINGIKDKDIHNITRQKLNREDKKDVLELLSDITLHDIFFSSFCDNTFLSHHSIRAFYGSEAGFLNEVYRECMSLSQGFVCVYQDEGRIRISGSSDNVGLFKLGTPILAIDIFEHAYFLDYGFDKDRYLRSALPYFDISKLG
jgi:Fe-Mn family superoxide dismutase